MIDYSDKDTENARMLKCRFVLINFMNQSQDYINEYYKITPKISADDIFDWIQIKREFKILLKYYDDGNKINEEFLLSLTNIKLTNNTILMNRLIKLIKIN